MIPGQIISLSLAISFLFCDLLEFFRDLNFDWEHVLDRIVVHRTSTKFTERPNVGQSAYHANLTLVLVRSVRIVQLNTTVCHRDIITVAYMVHLSSTCSIVGSSISSTIRCGLTCAIGRSIGSSFSSLAGCCAALCRFLTRLFALFAVKFLSSGYSKE